MLTGLFPGASGRLTRNERIAAPLIPERRVTLTRTAGSSPIHSDSLQEGINARAAPVQNTARHRTKLSF